jgi:transposase
MAYRKKDEGKRGRLRRQGCLNRHPERVEDELFARHEFLDPEDLVQLRYEMLRRVRVDGEAVSQAAARFGRSRPAFYAAQQRFEQEGLPGLVSRKPGPKGGHKLTAEVLDFLEELLEQEPVLGATDLVARVAERFGLEVHPRSVERALVQRKKNSAGRS